MKTRSFWTVLISCHHVIMSPSHLFTICKDRCGSLRLSKKKRAPFALFFFFPWWKVKILGAAKYSGDFLPAIDALFLWIASLKLDFFDLGMDPHF